MDGLEPAAEGPLNVRSRWVERIRSRAWAKKLLLAVPALVLVSLFTVTGLRGINFGFHWDEVDWQLTPVRESVASGMLMPRAAIYPAGTKWLILIPSLPATLRTVLDPEATPRNVQAAMLAELNAPNYLLRVRRVFLVVSSLALVWTYAACLVLGRRWWEAFIAAAGLGLSWEYAYHSRYLASDCIVVQFAALVLLLLALFHRSNKPIWLYSAAIAAGLATGTKFPAAALLLPVVVSSLAKPPASAWPFVRLRSQVKRVVAIGALAFLAYLITTPATILEPFAFIEQLRFISAYYAKGHYGYTVASTWEHWRIVLTYFAVAYFSPFPWAAATLLASSVLGAVFWVRSEPRMAAVLVGFPIAFLVWYCSGYLTVIIRNYLMIVPFLSVLCARGISGIAERLPFKGARWAFASAVGALFVAQAIWLVRAGESIRHVDPRAYVRELLAYINEHPDTRFRVSNQVRTLATELRLALPTNVTDRVNADAFAFFAKTEGPNPAKWRTNDPWQAQAVFGPREVNFAWYPSWAGHDRIVVLSAAKAKATGAPLAQ